MYKRGGKIFLAGVVIFATAKLLNQYIWQKIPLNIVSNFLKRCPQENKNVLKKDDDCI